MKKHSQEYLDLEYQLNSAILRDKSSEEIEELRKKLDAIDPKRKREFED